MTSRRGSIGNWPARAVSTTMNVGCTPCFLLGAFLAALREEESILANRDKDRAVLPVLQRTLRLAHRLGNVDHIDDSTRPPPRGGEAAVSAGSVANAASPRSSPRVAGLISVP